MQEKVQDLRETMARLETSMEFFKDALIKHDQRQTEIHDRICKRLEGVEADVKQVESKVTYAAGAVAVIIGFVTTIANYIMGKIS